LKIATPEITRAMEEIYSKEPTRRIAAFAVPMRIINANPVLAQRIQRDLTVVSCQARFNDMTLQFIALGEMFDEWPSECTPPKYDVVLETIRTPTEGSGFSISEKFIKFERFESELMVSVKGLQTYWVPNMEGDTDMPDVEYVKFDDVKKALR
jgi:hypothetical protein